jgi:hypothetical protein
LETTSSVPSRAISGKQIEKPPVARGRERGREPRKDDRTRHKKGAQSASKFPGKKLLQYQKHKFKMQM